MRLKTLIAGLMAALMMGGFLSAPTPANAQVSRYTHRQHMKNDWRNFAYLGAGLGLYGALNHDSTLAFLGTAGALYSASRYEQDRKSQRKLERMRAYYFSRGYYTYNGHRYRRAVTTRNGTTYYYFTRS